ncbi:MAG: NEAT domain-containing protein [Candidatus Fimenecus sp.]
MKIKVLSIISFCFLIFMILVIPTFAVTDNQLEDGEYNVKIKLWHSTENRESMAASAFYEDAKIVVSNKMMTMYVDTKSLTISGLTASLQEMEVLDESGKYVCATIEEKDSSGNPKKFSFNLPHTKEYLNVKVNPKVILMANQSISARIKIDYSSLEMVEGEITEKQIKIIEKTTEKRTTTTVPITTEKISEKETENFETLEDTSLIESKTSEKTKLNKINKNYNKIKITVVVSFIVILIIAITVGIIIVIKKKKE